MIRDWKKICVAIVAALPAAAGYSAALGDAAKGKALYEGTCATCHGADGSGGSLGPPLNGDKSTALTNDQLLEVITKGRPEKGMAAFGELLTADEIKDLGAYIRTMQTKYDPKNEAAATAAPAKTPTPPATPTASPTPAGGRGSTPPSVTPRGTTTPAPSGGATTTTGTRGAATPAPGRGATPPTRGGSTPAPRSNDRPTTRTAASAAGGSGAVAASTTAGAHAPLSFELAMAGGEATAGEKVFRNEGGCIKCHTIFNGGGKIAPDLSHIAGTLTKEQVYEAVAQPSKVIDAQFKTKEVVANTGESFVSPFRNETPESIQFLSKQGSGWNTYLKNELQTLKDSDKSYMPEGLLANLDEKQQKDLFAFLLNLK